jgi:hypothetical protein
MFEVPINLHIVAELDRDEPLAIRSVLSPVGERSILIKMASSDPLVGRALQKCDVVLTKFLVAAVLAEYLNFWRGKADGQAIRSAIFDAANLSKITYSGLGLAGRIARSTFLANLDSAQIFGPMPPANQVELRRMHIPLLEQSDIPHWRGGPGAGG